MKKSSKAGYITHEEVNRITIRKIKLSVYHPDLDSELIVNANFIFDNINGVTITFDPQTDKLHTLLDDYEFRKILNDIKDLIIEEYCK